VRKPKRPAREPDVIPADQSTASLSDEELEVIERLKRVEGQVRGLLRMISEGEDCRAVVTQMSAARSALDRAAFLYLAAHMRDCLSRKAPDSSSPSVEEMMEMFVKLA